MVSALLWEIKYCFEYVLDNDGTNCKQHASHPKYDNSPPESIKITPTGQVLEYIKHSGCTALEMEGNIDDHPGSRHWS